MLRALNIYLFNASAYSYVSTCGICFSSTLWVLRPQYVHSPVAHWLASLVKIANSRSSERPCFKKNHVEINAGKHSASASGIHMQRHGSRFTWKAGNLQWLLWFLLLFQVGCQVLKCTCLPFPPFTCPWYGNKDVAFPVLAELWIE